MALTDRKALADGRQTATRAPVEREGLGRRVWVFADWLSPAFRTSRSAFLGLFIAALLLSQPLLAADQAADVAAVPAHLVAGDDCRDIVADGAPDHGEEPARHCQACCAHQNNPALGSPADPSHAADVGRLPQTADRSRTLNSVRLPVEVDPPRA